MWAITSLHEIAPVRWSWSWKKFVRGTSPLPRSSFVKLAATVAIGFQLVLATRRYARTSTRVDLGEPARVDAVSPPCGAFGARAARPDR